MSFQAMAWAVDQNLPMREKMVLLILANYASNERGDCHPSVGLLSKDCGASKDSIIRAIKSLEDQGFVTVNRRMSEGVNLPNTYTLNMRGVVAPSDYGGSSTQRGGVVAESDTNLSPEPIRTSSLRSDVKAQAPAKPSVKSELMKVLDEERAQAVIDHRKAIKKPMTFRAAQLLAVKFARCPNPDAAADMMISAGWQGFEPEWIENRQSSVRADPPPKRAPKSEFDDPSIMWMRLGQKLEESNAEHPDCHEQGLFPASDHAGSPARNDADFTPADPQFAGRIERGG